MVNSRIMCRKHLLGEHLELHMFIGTIKQQKKLNGYFKNNLIEPIAIKKRHKQLVEEMKRRGYKHNSPIDFNFQMLNYLSVKRFNMINKEKSLRELLNRCKECRYQTLIKNF